MVINDWSAHDIQNGICSLSLFSKKLCHLNIMVVTMDALEPFRQGPTQKPHHYLIYNKGKHAFDINLEVAIQPEKN
jgi:fumarylacetoacetase